MNKARRAAAWSAWWLLGLVGNLAPLAQAQSPILRGRDTRTLAPETVQAGRRHWGADLTLGGISTRGNVDTNLYNGGFSLFTSKAPSSVYLSGTAIYGTKGSVRQQNQGAMTFRYDHALRGAWKAFAFDTNAYNEFLRLNYRHTVGAGPWVDLAAGPSTHGLSLAVTHEYERFEGGVREDAARLSLRTLSKIPVSELAQLTADIFYVPKADDFGDYHFYAELAFQTMFWKENLGMKVSWIEEYDSRPRPGVRRMDTLWLTSLTLRFGI